MAAGFKIFVGKIIFLFLPVNANSSRLDPVIRLNLVYSTFSCILLVNAAGPCFPLPGKGCKSYVTFFDH
jgi:hypothetical protein